ncbi:MAG: hypothetical protein Q7S68_03530 [Deltaproteobacteria bacterium]|nr:hypothetical protein [Deltaproteobacteria bacterium]
MKRMSKAAQAFFRDCGKKGGKKRAQSLSFQKRKEIASQAARSRWGEKKSSSVSTMPSIRLDKPDWHDPVYLEEILSDGGRHEWRELYLKLYDKPFGATADALEKIVGATKIYGATKLWEKLLKNLRGNS